MAREQDKRLAQLLQAYESGLLDEDTYRAAIAALKAATEAESGAVAQGEGAVAVGEHAVVVGGDLGGDIITGNAYHGPPPKSAEEALRIYRRVLVQNNSFLPLRGVDLGASDPSLSQSSLGLPQVYTGLDTTTQVERLPDGHEVDQHAPLPRTRETKPLTALRAAIKNRQLVLLGDPGSGKTIFVRHLAYCLAAHQLEPDNHWIDRLPNWPAAEVDILPIIIVLRDFASYLPDEIPHRAESGHLWSFIQAWLESQQLEFAASAILRILEEGRALLLLDGLDDVSSRKKRAFVRDAVMAFFQRFPTNRVLVTCRVLSYQDEGLHLPGRVFPSFEIALFNTEKIDQFISAWYSELARRGSIPSSDTQALISQLRAAVHRPDLLRLAHNPLLLTVMALTHTHKGRLPDVRALLYEETVDMLLWRWEETKQGVKTSIRQLLQQAGQSEIDLKRVLWKLAFEAHNQTASDEQGESLADISEWKLIQELAKLNEQDLSWAREMVSVMKLRTGLLLERAPGQFAFPHRTFQEYLAGAHLSSQSDFPKLGTELAEDTLWREVILLAVSRLVRIAGDMYKPLILVQELCPQQSKNDTLSWYKAWLAGDILLEAGLRRVTDTTLGQETLDTVRARIAELVSNGHLTPRLRSEAGNTLARLGDPRPGVGSRVIDGEVVPDLILCFVPAGPFWMGSSDDDPMATEIEKPLHELDMPYDYWIGLYPITESQFQTFIKQSGYHDKPGFNGATNHPVQGVSWYDAYAFCRWLNHLASENGFLPDNYFITLPSEAEWEKASRGGAAIPDKPILVSLSEISAGINDLELVPNPEPFRIYPWGNNLEKDRANYYDIGLMKPSAIGAFSGQSPYGLLDASGNVFEWTRSRWGQNPKQPTFRYPYNHEDSEDLEPGDLRVLRGGNWDSQYSDIRCSFRDRDFPDSKFHGLRIAVVPFRETFEFVRWFLEQAGFLINQKYRNGTLCTSSEQFWSDVSPIYVHMDLDRALDLSVFQEILVAVDSVYKDFDDEGISVENHLAVAVIDRPPQIGDLHQMYAIQAHHGLTIIPLPLSLMTQARIDRREKEAFREQIDRYLGKTDLYNVPDAVSDVLSFFGREGDLKEIYRNLTGGHSVILSGIRKIGKSSFLARLRESSSWPVSSVDLEGYFGALDFAYEEIIVNWHAAIGALYPKLTLPVWKGIPESARFPRKAQLFRKAVDELLTVLSTMPGKPGLLLFLDEMEYLFEDKDNYLSFASSLRGIAQSSRWQGRFAILATGLEPDINRIDHVFGNRNPFYSYFVEKPLGCLDFSATRRMIVTIGSQMGVRYTDEAVELLVEAGGGHPSLTRQLCSLAVSDKDRPLTIDAQQARLAIDAYLNQPHNYFAVSLWAIDDDGPNTPEAEILKILSIHPSCDETILLPRKLPNADLRQRQLALAKLQGESLVKKVNDGKAWQLTIPLYQRWIRRTILNLPDQLGGSE